MTDRAALTPFERRVAEVLDTYTSAVVDPMTTDVVATRAMTSPGVGRGWMPWLRVVAIAALLLLGLAAAVVLSGHRPVIGDLILTVGCGADTACPEGQGVWVSRSDGSDQRQLFTDQSVQMYHAMWTPDGRRVLATDQNDLYLSGLDGPSSKIVECRIPCLGTDEPAVSPDGSRIAYTTSLFPAYEAGEIGYTGTMQIVVAPFNEKGLTGPPQELVRVSADGTGGDQIAGPRWSPDGRTLLYTVVRLDGEGHGTGSAVFTVDATGGTPRQLTDWTTFAGDADWSPDGVSIVYATYPDGVGRTRPEQVSELWLMSRTGEGARQLTSSREPYASSIKPRFRPDGRIVYGVFRPGTPEVRLLDPRDMTDVPVITGLTRYMPDWQPAPGS